MKKAIIKILAITALSSICGSCAKTEPPQPFGVCPTPQQVEWQSMEMNLFCHFGPNTFSGLEWGDGNEADTLFNPIALDCRQWVDVAEQGGFKGIIITAKHHDGFCLWPSSYSTHTVAHSSWRDGRGDVLQELKEACEGRVKMGVYISPWDRNHPTYGSDQYNSVFANTLAEVHEAYGPLFEQWLDGANGEGPNGKRQEYDWCRIDSTLIAANSSIVIFSDVGPGCRWVGNEEGAAGETCWSTLNIEGFTPGSGSPGTEVLNHGNQGGSHWVPAETDVSIRPGWFYHPDEQPKTLKELLKIYYNSVGRNSLLLLNVPPDRRGLIPTEDSLRIVEFHKALDSIFATDLAAKAKVTATHQRGGKRCTTYRPSNVLDGNYDSFWAVDDSVLSPTLTLSFKEPVTFNRVMLQEYIPLGQRIEAFHVEYKDNDGEWQRLAQATTVGYKRILLTETVTTREVRITIDRSMACPVINRAGIFMDNIL